MTEKHDELQPDASNTLSVGDDALPAKTHHAWRLPALVVAFSLALLYIAFLSFTYKDPVLASRCKMAWMSPGYIRMNGLDESHSRLARKYTLWMYREQGWDLSNKVRGICCTVNGLPVLIRISNSMVLS